MSKSNGGAAFPVPKYNSSSAEYGALESGMTLRDYFAAQALAGWIANSDAAMSNSIAHSYALDAYMIADAMLAARAPGGAR